MREFIKSMLSFSWAMSLFGAKTVENIVTPQNASHPQHKAAGALDSVTHAARAQLGEGLKTVFETGDRLQRGMVDMMFSPPPSEKPDTGSTSMHPNTAQPRHNPGHGASHDMIPGNRGSGNQNSNPHAKSYHVQFVNQTQGPFWPPSEVMDADGNFIVVGGFLLTEVAPGKIAPVPNEKGAIVSKDTVPPLKEGVEDFSNPFGAPYKVIRELDLSPGGKDWDLTPYSLSAGPFVGDFGGFPPREPGAGNSQYNLNSNPRWNRFIAPVNADSPDYYRPSYLLNQVPIWRLQDIPEFIPIGVRVDSDSHRGAEGGGDDFRTRQPITLKEYLRGQGELKITPMQKSESAGGFTHARFEFAFEKLLPNSMYGIWALRSATLLPPTSPNFQSPTPLAIPNILITDRQGNAAVSFEVRNPFPAPDNDPYGIRLQALALTYLSDFQNWGASFTSIGTGVDAHTAMAANFSQLTDLITVEPSG